MILFPQRECENKATSTTVFHTYIAAVPYHGIPDNRKAKPGSSDTA